MKEFQIVAEKGAINGLLNESINSRALVILAHGAGAPMTHSFMVELDHQLSERSISVLRFNFPYIEAGKKFPGSPKVNIEAWKLVTEYALKQFDVPVFLSGKSYGGRMASHLMAENPEISISGLIYFGFPLHAPGKATTERASHLDKIQVPQLFLQGTKDALARTDLITQVTSQLNQTQLVFIEGADHSFKIKGQKHNEVIAQLANVSADWIKSHF